MQVRTVHELPSFARYLNKTFDFRASAATMADSRTEPQIPPSAVFLATFHGFVFRLRSFQQLEAEISQPCFQNWIGAGRAFRDDVLRYSLSGFSLAPLEDMLVRVNRTLKRNKVFDAGRVQGRIVAAMDGIEVLSSYSRCCDLCQERRVHVRKGGVKVEQVQYYHRAVACQIVSSPVKAVLGLEWLQPGEGEDTAALRLLNRLPAMYGSRFFDILLLDALYAQVPVLRCAAQHGWDLVISLKQNQPDLYRSAMQIFARRPADQQISETIGGKTYQCDIWDTPSLPLSADHSQALRVVRSEEKLTQNHYRSGQLQPETTDHEWMWMTTLETQAFAPLVVRGLGHSRWKPHECHCDNQSIESLHRVLRVQYRQESGDGRHRRDPVRIRVRPPHRQSPDLFAGSPTDQQLRPLPAFPRIMLWAVRALLLVSVVLHITASVQLWRLKQKARPKPT
jgi:hypothetical protein